MDEALIKKIMPHSPEAEMSVVGSMLMDVDSISYATEHLDASDFYSESYRLLFTAIRNLSESHRDVDFVTLQDELRSMKAPDELCELGYIRDLVNSVPSSANMRHYCKLVSDYALARRLIKAGENISSTAYLGDKDIENQLESAEKQIYDVIQRRSDDELTPVSQIVMDTLELIRKASQTSGTVTGVPTGFADLDMKTSGLQPSNLVLIAARPAMGKTAFVLNIAEHAAVKNDYKVALFSLEMGKEELMKRFFAMDSLVNSENLRRGDLSESDWEKLVESAGFISNSSLMIYDTPGITVSQLRSRCRKLKIDHGLDLVIIDYLQLMTPGSNTDSRQQQIADISRNLKILARELNVPIIALSQLSRAVEQRTDHRPMLSDLRESGAIEQDADIVMFIYRDEVYNENTENKNIAEIIIAKHRNGSIGTVELIWRPEYTRFASKEWRE
ncbi:MAG: replicative DNA helicase [Lachnospiraceae bacterium]|nr:replicative DNA helicase [Lachnospiraceae bacterium]